PKFHHQSYVGFARDHNASLRLDIVRSRTYANIESCRSSLLGTSKGIHVLKNQLLNSQGPSHGLIHSVHLAHSVDRLPRVLIDQ
ncbi:hypothetical protein P692DRAFT_201796688, partial [Suillus brevipes Sb2]